MDDTASIIRLAVRRDGIAGPVVVACRAPIGGDRISARPLAEAVQQSPPESEEGLRADSSSYPPSQLPNEGRQPVDHGTMRGVETKSRERIGGDKEGCGE
jgi:hypothetical protein